MKRTDLEDLVLDNVRSASDQVKESGYFNQVLDQNLKQFGDSSPVAAPRTYQAETIMIISKALTQTLIDLKVVEIDSSDNE